MEWTEFIEVAPYILAGQSFLLVCMYKVVDNYASKLEKQNSNCSLLEKSLSE